VNTMYEKPEIELLGDAAGLINGSHSNKEPSGDGPPGQGTELD